MVVQPNQSQFVGNIKTVQPCDDGWDPMSKSKYSETNWKDRVRISSRRKSDRCWTCFSRQGPKHQRSWWGTR